MDADLITIIVIGIFLNALVLFRLIKIYKDFIGVVWRFGIFAIIQALSVYFIFETRVFMTVLMLGLLVIYMISLSFRFSDSKIPDKEVTTFESLKSVSDEEREEMARRRKEQSEKRRNELNERNALKCPHCKSKNVNFMQNNRKSFSMGKAAAGTILTGGIGAVAGFAGKKGNDQWHCQECGQVFETKHKK